MSTKHELIGDEKPAPEALQQMRDRAKPDTKWAAYQNHDMSNTSLGHLQFLQIGVGCTYAEAPERMPDSHLGIGWRYLFVGFVNLETGNVEEVKGRIRFEGVCQQS